MKSRISRINVSLAESNNTYLLDAIDVLLRQESITCGTYEMLHEKLMQIFQDVLLPVIECFAEEENSNYEAIIVEEKLIEKD